MSLFILAPTNAGPSEPSPCGGDMAPRPMSSREDILRQLNTRVTVSYNVFYQTRLDFDELVVRLLWDAFSDPYSMDSSARQTFLQSTPEYISAKAELENTLVNFHDAVAMRDGFIQT